MCSSDLYRHRGPARVFVDERAAIRAVKGGDTQLAAIKPNDVIVLIGNGPSGTGMQETAQVTTALKYLPWGKLVALVTDGRFSGLSTGACIGHVGPEALDNGPIGRVRDGDVIEIVLDRVNLVGSVNVVGIGGVGVGRRGAGDDSSSDAGTDDPNDASVDDANRALNDAINGAPDSAPNSAARSDRDDERNLAIDACTAVLRERTPHPDLAPHPSLPDDTRLWAALQRASGGTWAGCVYDVDRIVDALDRASRPAQ